jgi:peptidoglycan/xylan/chitin deacetylase (PgdA/CDA1 family)
MATIGATTPTIVIDSIRFVPAAPKATYFLTFDDGKDTDLLVTSYLDSKGLKGTFNISPNKIETEGDRLTISQMLTMQNNGHLIANHSWDGEDLRDDSLSFNQGVDSIVKATDWMVTNGFSKGSKNWTVPGGTGNSYGWVDGAIVNDWELLKPYCDTIRHTDTEALRPAGILSGKNLFTVDFDAPADAIDYLNQNYIDNGSVVIFGFHSWAATVSSGGVLTSDFTDLIDALAALVASGDAEVMTLDDISAPPSIVAAKGAYRGRYSGGRR